MRVRCWLSALLLFAPLLNFAQGIAPTPEDPVANQRAMALASVLRCLVCQNQTIAESNASLASDLRAEIRELIAQGKSDDDIKDYMVARYGDFVLYKPPLKATTVLLWFGPLLFLVVGAILLLQYMGKRRLRIAAQPLSDGERQIARELLAGELPPVQSPTVDTPPLADKPRAVAKPRSTARRRNSGKPRKGR